MDFQTLVDTDAVGIKIEHDESVMMLGSCFAEDVGNSRNWWSTMSAGS